MAVTSNKVRFPDRLVYQNATLAGWRSGIYDGFLGGVLRFYRSIGLCRTLRVLFVRSPLERCQPFSGNKVTS